MPTSCPPFPRSGARAGRDDRRMGRCHPVRVFGQYRAPTGVSAAPSNRTQGAGGPPRGGRPRLRRGSASASAFFVAKPGLDGHSNGAEQIAARARDAGIEMTYDGIRPHPRPKSPIARFRRGRT